MPPASIDTILRGLLRSAVAMTFFERRSGSRESSAESTLYGYWWRYSFRLPAGGAVIRI